MSAQWHQLSEAGDACVIGLEVEVMLLHAPPKYPSKWTMRIGFRRVEIRQTVCAASQSSDHAREKAIRLAVERLRKNADQLEELLK